MADTMQTTTFRRNQTQTDEQPDAVTGQPKTTFANADPNNISPKPNLTQTVCAHRSEQPDKHISNNATFHGASVRTYRAIQQKPLNHTVRKKDDQLTSNVEMRALKARLKNLKEEVMANDDAGQYDMQTPLGGGANHARQWSRSGATIAGAEAVRTRRRVMLQVGREDALSFHIHKQNGTVG